MSDPRNPHSTKRPHLKLVPTPATDQPSAAERGPRPPRSAAGRAKILARRAWGRYRKAFPTRFDLGLTTAIPEWPKMFRSQHLRADLVAALTVASATLPLSLAVTVAGRVDPKTGLIAAVLTTLVTSLMGGTRVGISGPALAMSVLMAQTVSHFGFTGLVICGLIMGIMQVALGVLGLGRLVRLVPLPVIAGFVIGTGTIIFIDQIPNALGVPPSDSAATVDSIKHLFLWWDAYQPSAIAFFAISVSVMLTLPKVSRYAPAPLLAVFVTTALGLALPRLRLETLEDVHRTMPTWDLPDWNAIPFEALVPLAAAMFFLGTIETLLTAKVLDSEADGPAHDPDQEMIAMGIANTIISGFGGIPVAGNLIRSRLNVSSGARTSRSLLFHSLALLALLLPSTDFLTHIPLAGLAGVLCVLAFQSLRPSQLVSLWETSRADFGIAIVTAATYTLFGLNWGIVAGIFATLLVSLLGQAVTRVIVTRAGDHGLWRLSISGTVTFVSEYRLDKLRKFMESVQDRDQGVVIDLSRVTYIDSSGCAQLFQFASRLQRVGTPVALQGPNPVVDARLRAGGPAIAALIVHGEAGIAQTLARNRVGHDGENGVCAYRPLGGDAAVEARNRMLFGVERFRQETRFRYQEIFRGFAEGQKPHTLFFSCSDSRINPNLVSTTEPGELFLVRNVGNIIPCFGMGGLPAEGAAIEYAIHVLGIRQIIVCGHTACGAMRAIVEGVDRQRLPSVDRWLQDSDRVLSLLPPKPTPNDCTLANVRVQLENLRTYPIVREQLAAGKLRIYGWVYDVTKADVIEWDVRKQAFVPVGHSTENDATKPAATPKVQAVPDSMAS